VTNDNDHYVVISSDTHAGAALPDYRAYLESQYHDAFDEWSATFVTPFSDLLTKDADRNWDSTRRMAELEADGVVAEVLYPNTIPPFFATGALAETAPSASEYEYKLAGLRAHNRWLAEWCAQYPGRRAGIGQILLNNIEVASCCRVLLQERRSSPCTRARTIRCGARARSAVSC